MRELLLLPDPIRLPHSKQEDILLLHGKDDTKVKPEWGQNMRNLLHDAFSVTSPDSRVHWEEYDDLGHSYNEPELAAVVGFLREVFPLP